MSDHTRSDQVSGTYLRNPSELSNSTSEFRWKDMKALNIYYKNGTVGMFGSMIDLSYNRSLLLQNVNKDFLFKVWNDDTLTKDWNNKERALARYISEILIKEHAEVENHEKVTDSFINFLLGILEFNEYPFALKLKANCYFQVHDKVVTSESDFSIWKNKLFITIDEDRHLYNINKFTWWGEYQIAGKLLASAFVNHKEIQEKYNTQTLFAIRVIGTRFTFYKAEIKSDYLTSLVKGFPTNNLYIYRYPEWNDQYTNHISYLDYTNLDQRRHILEIIIKIKNFIIQNKTIL
ncbi:hypothetical protein Glove_21g355 [Diversispora epigaea]|uniref:Uncharacterized protein n=1 Tax=Diversispora epigaea TaxID=1348612 RepID=A0A397JMH6_9GLOM|nr:hypothetical protein Glove_21g355 [Diversispora epigaea]